MDEAYYVASKLGGAKKISGQWRCLCPLHDDRSPSLDIKQGEKGLVFICRAGCDQKELFNYMKENGYLPELKKNQPIIKSEPKLVKTYHYTNQHGEIIYEKLRYEPKTFKARHINELGKMVWGINGIEQPLYLRHTLNDIKGKQVVIVEGEKDADFVSDNYGMLATSPPNGTGSWKESYASVFTGADVVICPDNDKPGEAMADKVYNDIKPFCNSVKIVNLPHGKDVSDWGGTADQFKEIIESVNEQGYSSISSRALVKSVKAPNYLIYGVLETDSHGILAGASGAYKSFMLLKMAASIADGKSFFNHRVFESNKVLYICGEGMSALSRRLKALDINEGIQSDNLLVLNQKIRIDNADDIREVNLHIQKLRPALVIFDTFSSMNSSTNENDNSEVASALNLIHSNISNGFTSTIISHHFGKDEERGLRGASAFTANSDFVMVMKKDAESNEATLKSIKCKDGDNFQDIVVQSKSINLGIVDQMGNQVTSLVLTREEKAKKQSLTDKFNEYYDACLEDDPVNISGEIGVTRKYFCNYVKNMVGQNSEYLRVQLSKHMRSGIYKINILEINNILVKNV